MRTAPVSRPPRTRTASAVEILLVLLLGTALAGCAYENYDGFAAETASPSAPPFYTDAALPRDPWVDTPVSGAELDEWVAVALPRAEGHVYHTHYGLLEAGQEVEEITANLPAGTYAVTLACRSDRRVSFSVGQADTELVDLNLRCGTSRVNVVYLPAGTALQFKVEARKGANFAYRVSRI
ncbi:MAG: hypothetical protein ABWX69_06220 [Arthrobacter sp.]